MNFKKENGYTITDISTAVVILFIFVSIIAMLFYEYQASSQAIERKSIATNYAISEIEQIKATDFSEYEGISVKNGNNIIAEENIENSNGYYKQVIVEDYADLNEGETFDLVKKVTVKIKYKFKNQEQTVEISTLKTKEN